MKIFYFARIDIATEDASTRHVLEFCRQFSAFGHQVTLFVPDMGSRRELAGVNFVYVPVIIRNPAVTFFSFQFFLFFSFIAQFIKSRPDIVYTRHQQLEWLVTWLKCFLKFKYVVEVNGLSLVELKIQKAPAFIISLTKLLEWICFRFPDRIVTPSAIISDTLCKNYGLDKNRFLTVTNGANLEFSRPLDKIECRIKLGFDPEKKYLVFVGALRKWHGIDEIVALMPVLLEKVPDIHLLLVGDGEMRPKIEKTVSNLSLADHVTLVGSIKYEEVQYYINTADVCLAPYFDARLNETGISPLKIFEYLACGKPIITNPVGGLGDVLQSHDVGVLIPSMEPKDWIDPIVQLITDPDRMKKFGANGREAVEKEFSWEVVCKKISDTLEETMTY